MTCSVVAPPIVSHRAVYNPGNETQGVRTCTPGTGSLVLKKYGRSAPGAVEKVTGLTHATCKPADAV